MLTLKRNRGCGRFAIPFLRRYNGATRISHWEGPMGQVRAREAAAAVVLIAIAACLLVTDHAGALGSSDTSALEAASPQDTNFTLEGTVTERAEGKLTVSTEENIIFHVVYGEKTEIKRKDGSAGAEKDLQKGVKIRVDGELAESGEIKARKIELE